MGSNGGSSLLNGGQCALVAAEESDAVRKLCIDIMQPDATGATAAVAVTGRQDPTALLERWQRCVPGGFRDVALLAFDDDTRAVAATEGNSGLGLVQPLGDSTTVEELLDRIEQQLVELAGDGDHLAVYVGPLGDRFDAGFYLELADGLDRVLSAHDAVGVVHTRPDLSAVPVIRSRFHSVLELDPVERSPPVADESIQSVELFEALSSRTRLQVLGYLRQRPGSPTDVEDLATTIAQSEGNTSTSAVRRRHVGLVHRDLPALEALGLLRYDADRAIVEPTDSIASVEPFLVLAGETPNRRS